MTETGRGKEGSGGSPRKRESTGGGSVSKGKGVHDSFLGPKPGLGLALAWGLGGQAPCQVENGAAGLFVPTVPRHGDHQPFLAWALRARWK